MKNEGKHAAGSFFRMGALFDALLLLVNSVGIVGALTESLEIPWRESQAGGNGLDRIVFWGGLFFLCMVVMPFRHSRNRKRVFGCVIICGIWYLFLGVACRESLSAGFSLAFQNAVENLNGNYGFHIVLNAASLGKIKIHPWAVTGCLLYILFPLELLAGLLGRYDKGFCLIAGNALWFTAACVCDRFPGFFFLAFCVLGAVADLVQKDFRKQPGVGFVVTCCAMAFAGLVMALTFRYFLPGLDRQYGESLEDRMEFYTLVNEEWIPRLKDMLPRGGLGSGVDVTGELGRSNLFAYTAGDVYRVTVDQVPQGALYLRGFVGDTYNEREWLASSDRELEQYYREHGIELPEDFGDFVNLTHEAAKNLRGSVSQANIRIEELGGRGSYSLYPYGALLPEESRVHGDGTVERRGSSYEFRYCFLSGIGGGDGLSGSWAETERQYRQYVYDNFLEYPEEDLPRLTEALGRGNIRSDTVFLCAQGLISFLGGQAVYNLDAANNPPGTDFVEYFLFESREGYCMHFASAGVLALRYFGIPARYATGYAAAPSDFTKDPDGKYTAVLTGRQAHAWAEVYLDGIGWVPVEMTPGAAAFPSDNRMEQLGQLGWLSGEVLTLSVLQPNWTLGQEREPERAVTTDPPQRLDGDGEADMPVLPERGKPQGEMGSEPEAVSGGEPGDMAERVPLRERMEFRMLIIVLATSMPLAALVRLERWELRRRRERFRAAGRRERIFLLYWNLRKVCQLAGIRREDAVDGEAFQQALWERFQVDGAEYERFCHILEKNTFGDGEPSEEELERVRSMHDRLAESAYVCVPFYKKPLVRHCQGCV